MSSNDNSDEIEESQKEQQALLQEQIDQSNAEIEQKRQAIFDERINIIRSQGAPVWSPGKTGTTPGVTPLPGKVENPLSTTSIGNYNHNSQTERGK